MTRPWSPVAAPDAPDNLILFDGVCVFCSRWLRFIAGRDRQARFRFASVQSPAGRRLALELGIDPGNPQTNAVIRKGMALFKSDAAIAVLAELPGWAWIAGVGRLMPRMLRDALYDLIARNRYRLFGQTELCLIPTPDLRGRFVDGGF